MSLFQDMCNNISDHVSLVDLEKNQPDAFKKALKTTPYQPIQQGTLEQHFYRHVVFIILSK